MPDWLTRNHHELRNTVNLVLTFFSNGENRVRLGFQTAGAPPTIVGQAPPAQYLTSLGTWYYDEFAPKANALKIAYSGWEEYSKRAPEDRVRLKDAEKALKQELRHLYKMIRYLPSITNVDLQSMGLPIRHAPTHTPSPVSHSHPVAVQPTSPTPGTVVIHYNDSKTGKTAKPKGAHGALMRYASLDKSPENWDALTSTVFSTTSPITLHFDLSMRGKTIYYAMCWENMTGQHGDFGAIGSFIVG